MPPEATGNFRRVEADPNLVALGAEVRRLRGNANLSQEALADLAGLHRTHLGKIERGEVDVTGATLFALGAALGVSPALFFDPKTEAPAPATKRRQRRQPA